MVKAIFQNKIGTVVVLISGLIFATTGFAGKPRQSLSAIEDAVSVYIGSVHPEESNVDIAVKPVDKRLILTACDVPLQTSWSPGSRTVGRVTVQVACSSPKPWRIHVQATARVEGEVWTLIRGAMRGDVLSRRMVEKKSVQVGGGMNVRASGSPITNITPWIGYSFTQRVNAGAVLDERVLAPAMLVKKGEIVLIVHESVGLQLQTRGVALQSAAEGSRVRVRNAGSGKVIETVVVGRGLVEIL